MKKTLFLIAALCIANMGLAQLPFATLTHNDSVRVFHGIYALQQAHAAAVNGDVINLSSGVFDAVNITKAVTIRGTGMFADSATGRQITSIRNSFTVAVTDTVNRLELIGLFFISGANMTIYKAYHPQFIKCRFQQVNAGYRNDNQTTDITYNARFINCIVQRWSSQNWDNCSSWSAQSTQFFNSVILGFNADAYTSREPGMQIVNSIAQISLEAIVLNNKTILNSILFWNTYSNGSLNGYTSDNCIGINTYYGNSAYFDLTNMSGHNLHNYSNFAHVFQTFRGTYSDGMSMALNDDIATTILGDDSTQVGIYGGYYPWDPAVNNPFIGHCTAARHTDGQGMLEVDIEIINNDDDDE